MFCYEEKKNNIKYPVDERFASVLIEQLSLLDVSYQLLNEYLYHCFKVQQYRKDLIVIVIRQLNIYEQMSDMVVALKGLDIDYIEGMCSYLPDCECIEKKSTEMDLEPFCDFCGLLLYLREQEYYVIEQLEFAKKQNKHEIVIQQLNQWIISHHECLTTLSSILDKMNHPERSYAFEEEEENYFDLRNPYFINGRM